MSLVLSFAALGALTGCVVSSPPDYEEEGRIPPVVEVVNPRPSVFTPFSPGDTVDFTVRFRSNDTTPDGQQSPIVWAFFRDFQTYDDFEDFLGLRILDPSTFDEVREIRIPYTFTVQREPVGCHQYTLVVTHLDNWDPVDRPEDVALVTWWITIGTEDQPIDVRDCLTEGQQ